MFRYNFQRLQSPVQPGSMDSEAGIFSLTFDRSGKRLITTEADKTIKMYKEDDTAVSRILNLNIKVFIDRFTKIVKLLFFYVSLV